jgi:sarcosine oxidase subunit gamma
MTTLTTAAPTTPIQTMTPLTMDKLTTAHPLSHVAPLVGGDLTASVAHRTVLELRGHSATLAARYPGLLPTLPNRTIAHGPWRALWLRPNAWLLSGPPDIPEDARHREMKDAANDDVQSECWPELTRPVKEGLCRVFDLSHARVCINLKGTATAAVLAKGTPLDLRPHRFPQGHCARTWCAGFTVVLDRVADGIDVYVDSSLAVAFWDWLMDAAVEWRSA